MSVFDGGEVGAVLGWGVGFGMGKCVGFGAGLEVGEVGAEEECETGGETGAGTGGGTGGKTTDLEKVMVDPPFESVVPPLDFQLESLTAKHPSSAPLIPPSLSLIMRLRVPSEIETQPKLSH